MTNNARWHGIVRPYSPEEVERLRPSVQIEHTLARLGAERLWNLLHGKEPVRSLGALTGNQAVQQVQAGLQAIYVSGWQVAGDANLAGQMYPDQSLYPSNSVPVLVRAINSALLRADQVTRMEGTPHPYWLAPIVADAEAGFGGPLNAFELMKAMIEAGAAAVHFEDQLSSAKKCGHLGGKVVVPVREFIQKLVAARLAADVLGVPALLIARTDADSARLLLSDADPRDEPFLEGGKTEEGFFHYRGGLDAAIARGLAYAPYADLIWCETSEPDFEHARRFAEAIHAHYPGKLLAYNCSPSFHWKRTADRRRDRGFPVAPRGIGLPVPVRHPGRIPFPERRDVRTGTGLCPQRYDGVRAAAGAGVRPGGQRRILRHPAPEVRRDGLLRRRADDHRRRPRCHYGPRRFDRAGAVRTSPAAGG